MIKSPCVTCEKIYESPRCHKKCRLLSAVQRKAIELHLIPSKGDSFDQHNVIIPTYRG